MGGALFNASGTSSLSEKMYQNRTTLTGEGGAIYIQGGRVSISSTNATIERNAAGTYGGGVYVSSGAEFNVIGGTVIQDNIAGTAGGGIANMQGGTVNITADSENIVFSGNYAGATFAGVDANGFIRYNGANIDVTNYGNANDIYNEGTLNITAYGDGEGEAQNQVQFSGTITDSESTKGAINISGSGITVNLIDIDEFIPLVNTGGVFFGGQSND